jgi:hypothetical protein
MSGVSGTSGNGVSSYGQEIASLINSDATTSEDIQRLLGKGKQLTTGDQILIQEALNERSMRVGFLTNLLRTLSETAMSVIRNLRP